MSVTPEDFRRLALALPETSESAHMDHPDFRVGGKIFATLGYPDKRWGMVKLGPEDQHTFNQSHPKIFIPVKGAWGRQGATSVLLEAIGKSVLRTALQAAWRAAAPKSVGSPKPRAKRNKPR